MHESTISRLPPFPDGYTLSPEFRLAAACSWIAPARLRSSQDETVKSLVGADIDGEAFLRLVDRHGIPVQALTVLRRGMGPEMPESMLRGLRARATRVAVRSAIQASELVRVNTLLRGHGIEIIPLKGVCLSQRLYGAPGSRAAGDIDVLVRPEQLAEADRLLTVSGYRNTYNLTDRQKAALLHYHQHLNYCRKESGLHLELHWRYHFWTRGAMEELWRARKTVVIMGEEFYFPADPPLFLFLCDHGSRHVWFCLKWLSDIAMMFANESIHDWEVPLELAERLGLRRVVAQTALLVHWLYGLPLPSRVSELVAGEKTALRLADNAITALHGGCTHSPLAARRMGGVRKLFYLKRSKPSIPFKKYLKESFICVTDYMSFPLPDRLFWMYVPLRPVFWFWRHFGGRLFAGFRSACGAEKQK